MTILHRHYTEVLKYAKKPPFVIFYKENIDLLEYNKIIAFVGISTLEGDESIKFNAIVDNLHKENVVFLSYKNTDFNNNLLNYCQEKNYSVINIAKDDMNTFLSKK